MQGRVVCYSVSRPRCPSPQALAVAVPVTQGRDPGVALAWPPCRPSTLTVCGSLSGPPLPPAAPASPTLLPASSSAHLSARAAAPRDPRGSCALRLPVCAQGSSREALPGHLCQTVPPSLFYLSQQRLSPSDVTRMFYLYLFIEKSIRVDAWSCSRLYAGTQTGVQHPAYTQTCA